ncbi:MAG: DUF3575 domain-containing protein [Prevotella sp.]|nr:DUF3575 domain-containing protein [Prevotella sp.]MBR2253976.1 DUF3575 domain-containing protein [Prevotella sp.]
MRNKFLLIIATVMLFAAKASAQMVAVNTDVAMDACMAPSLGVELTLGKKSTLNINGLYAANMLGKDIRIAAIQPEWRVYISGRPMFHHYVGAIGLLASYKFSHFADKVYDGDAGGLGLSYGYVWPVTQRLLIDFHTSLGLVFYHQKEYFVGDDYDSHYLNDEGNPYANAHGSLLMPLRIGISVSYIIK